VPNIQVDKEFKQLREGVGNGIGLMVTREGGRTIRQIGNITKSRVGEYRGIDNKIIKGIQENIHNRDTIGLL
jgi:hypothetical protein